MNSDNRMRFRILALLALAITIWTNWGNHALQAPRFGLTLGVTALLLGTWIAALFMTRVEAWNRISAVVGLGASALATIADPGLSTLMVVSVGWVGSHISWPRMRSLGVATVVFACAVSVVATGRVTGWPAILTIIGEPQFVNLVFLFSVALLLGRFATDNTAARQAQAVALAELQKAHAELQRRAATVEELATLRERARLSRELHDTLGHALSGITVQLEAVRRMMPQQPSRADELLREAQEEARSAMRDLRVHLSELREASAPEDLPQALRLLAEAAAAQAGWTLALDVRDAALPAGGRQALFQVAKEALANCERHAGAHRVLLRLAPAGADAALTVEDDGCGFDPGRIAKDHFGIAGMRERLTELGGELAIETGPGRGTRVTATLPCRQEVVGGV